MSLLFLIGFIMVLRGEIPTDEFGSEWFTVWALFAIADAIWIGRR